MKRPLRVRYRAALYRLRRVDPRTWPAVIRASRWRRRVRAAHATALYHPGSEDTGPPAVEVGGVLVFAYLDPRHTALRVSVDLDTVAPWLLNDAERVPMLISVQGNEVFSADYPRAIR